ncbi:hypothetical protein M2390_002665 [Mycetocola sp. BIGb0189]|uniref:hypothetical protein n=1 Tax=Mycetocola sp. BIGb0189 TaxID=2940604 RepID=UPI00216925B7|nr:hypothetical protein [Mycetocola sp. BIGb0189]MCS4277459.1 hypothetical protein [Mycetocola sp. BIGb0189]
MTLSRHPLIALTLASAVALGLVGCIATEPDPPRPTLVHDEEEAAVIDTTREQSERNGTGELGDGLPPLNADITVEDFNTDNLFTPTHETVADLNGFGTLLAESLQRLDNAAFAQQGTAKSREDARLAFIKTLTGRYTLSEDARRDLERASNAAVKLGTEPVPDHKSTVTASRVRLLGGGIEETLGSRTRVSYEIIFARDLTGSPVRERWDEIVAYGVLFDDLTGEIARIQVNRTPL